MFTFNGIVYEVVNGNEVELYKTEGLKRPVRNIPAEVEYEGKKYKVTQVFGGKRRTWEDYWSGYRKSETTCGAFENDEILTNLSLPETFTKINSPMLNEKEDVYGYSTGAFKGCVKLKDIYFPNSLTEIGLAAFKNCTAIESLYFGDNLKSIRGSAFEGCTALKDIDFNDKLETIGGSAFSGCSSLNNVSFPESLKTINGYAFYGCKAMSEVNIPASVESIDSKAFAESGVKVVNIYSENVNIAEDAFPADAQINFLDANSFPKRKRKPRGAKNIEAPSAPHANEEPAKPAPKEEKVKETPKIVPVDMEKLIQAALTDGVVTDKERSILIKKVKEAGGDVDEFELLLDARIYEMEQKSKAAEKTVQEPATPKPEPKPKAEKVQAEEKPQPRKEENDLPNESANSDSGWSREKWENWEKDVKPALKIMDTIVAAMPFIQDGSYQLNYTSKIYIGFAQNGKAKNFAVFFPQGKALVVNVGMEKSAEIDKTGNVLPNFEHKVGSRNDNFYTFKFPVDKAVTAEQIKAAVAIIDTARKNKEK